MFRASGHDGDGSDISAGISGIAGGKAVVGVIADLMLDGVASRAGKKHLPGSARVAAPPERRIPGIDDLGVRRIENENIDYSAEIKHMPGLAIVARNVPARHIAVLDHQLWVVRADSRANRGAAAAGANYFPAVRTRALSETGQRGKKQ